MPQIRLTAFVALLALLALGENTARAQAARSLTGEAVEGSKSAFRGSMLIYEHSGQAISAFKSAEPTWNPYYDHSLQLRPEWHFSEKLPFFVRGRLTIAQELTWSDSTKYKNEIVLSDTTLEGVWTGWSEPNTKIRINGTLRAVAPTSKASLAQSLYVQLAPGLTAIRGFELFGMNLMLGYSGRYAKNFHGYTTGQFDGPTIACKDIDSPECSRFLHTGVRNASWSVSHGPLLIVSPTSKLTLTLSSTFLRSQLYDLHDTVIETATGSVELGEGSGVNARYANVTSLDANWQFNDIFAASFGAYTFASQTGPDGTYRNPFVNRFTSLYLDIIVDVERAWAATRALRK